MNNSDKQKTYDYLILLKKNNDNLADQVSQLLYVFAIAAFGFFIYTYPSNSTNYIFVIAAIIIIMVLQRLLHRLPHQNQFPRYH